jgi:hypothetical protein
MVQVCFYQITILLLLKLTSQVKQQIQAIQQVMDEQLLSYDFPFSTFQFPTDLRFLLLTHFRSSQIFRVESFGDDVVNSFTVLLTGHSSSHFTALKHKRIVRRA